MIFRVCLPSNKFFWSTCQSRTCGVLLPFTTRPKDSAMQHHSRGSRHSAITSRLRSIVEFCDLETRRPIPQRCHKSWLSMIYFNGCSGGVRGPIHFFVFLFRTFLDDGLLKNIGTYCSWPMQREIYQALHGDVCEACEISALGLQFLFSPSGISTFSIAI